MSQADTRLCRVVDSTAFAHSKDHSGSLQQKSGLVKHSHGPEKKALTRACRTACSAQGRIAARADQEKFCALRMQSSSRCMLFSISCGLTSVVTVEAYSLSIRRLKIVS